MIPLNWIKRYDLATSLVAQELLTALHDAGYLQNLDDLRLYGIVCDLLIKQGWGKDLSKQPDMKPLTAAELAKVQPMPASGWNFDMSKAPHDNTLLQLLIRQDEDHSCGFDDAHITRTMGFNNFDNDGIDEWKFPGWSWTHDCINEQGHGTPIAWALMLECPAEVLEIVA